MSRLLNWLKRLFKSSKIKATREVTEVDKSYSDSYERAPVYRFRVTLKPDTPQAVEIGLSTVGPFGYDNDPLTPKTLEFYSSVHKRSLYDVVNWLRYCSDSIILIEIIYRDGSAEKFYISGVTWVSSKIMGLDASGCGVAKYKHTLTYSSCNPLPTKNIPTTKEV